MSVGYAWNMSTDFSQEDDQSGAEIARVALQLAHLVNTSGTDRSTKVLSCRLLAKIGKDVQEKAIDRDNQDSQGLDDNISKARAVWHAGEEVLQSVSRALPL